MFKVTYTFPHGTFKPVTFDTCCLPNVGERVGFQCDENMKSRPELNYNNSDWWRVKERLFLVTVPGNRSSSFGMNSYPQVEIVLEEAN